jgi:ribonuclease HI
VVRQSWGVTPKYAKRLYSGVALPRVLYGADIWSLTTQSESKDLRVRSCGKATKLLTTTQRAGALAITGGLRTSPTDTLDAISYLLPAELTIYRFCRGALARLMTLPADHPLHTSVKSNLAHSVVHHRAPLHNLRLLYDQDPRKIEKIPSTTRDPKVHGKLPFNISIAEDRDNSIEEARNATEDIQVFTDGSAMEGGVGAAAALYIQGEQLSVTHFYLGPDTEHTVHEAELVGMLLGIHLVDKTITEGSTCAIGVDNQATLLTLQSDLRSPGQHLARKILLIANRMQKRVGPSNYKLTFRWTAGHEGIEGNEEVDGEAKKAAEGRKSDNSSLPPYLRRPLMINPSALKQHHTANLKKEWTNVWRNSSRGDKLLKLDKTTPSKNFLNRLSNPALSRKAASLITQLAIKHVPLNAYLERFKRVDSARCPVCREAEETVEHFLLECPGYEHERWNLKNEATKLSKTIRMDTLLGDPDLTILLATYIDATLRFKTPSTS